MCKRTTVVFALIRAVPAVGRAITQLLVLDALASGTAGELAGATGPLAGLFVLTARAVGLPITAPGHGHAVPINAAKLMVPTSWHFRP